MNGALLGNYPSRVSTRVFPLGVSTARGPGAALARSVGGHGWERVGFYFIRNHGLDHARNRHDRRQRDAAAIAVHGALK
jgi:hypothetical protein